jgi:hypothetical protein
MRTYKMKKQTPAQTEAEKVKARLTEMLTIQIEKLVNSSVFELSDIFEIFQNCLNQRGSFSVQEFDQECKKVVLLTGGFLIEDLNYLQEIALKECCKQNYIKLLDYWTV